MYRINVSNMRLYKIVLSDKKTYKELWFNLLTYCLQSGIIKVFIQEAEQSMSSKQTEHITKH